MAEHMILHGIQWLLTGTTDWTHPDVQVKMAQARQELDTALMVSSHTNPDREPSYGRDEGINFYDTTPVFDDDRVLAGGDIDGLGYRWQYTAGWKFIHVDHYERKPPEYWREEWWIAHRPIYPCIVAFRNLGTNDGGYGPFEEIGFIAANDGYKPPYAFYYVPEHQRADLAYYNNYGTKSENYTGIKRLWPARILTGEASVVSPREWDSVATWWEIRWLCDEKTADYPDWTQINPGYEEMIPVGLNWVEGSLTRDLNVFDYCKWISGTFTHEFGSGECWQDPANLLIHTRKAEWMAGQRYLQTICEADKITPIIAEDACPGHVREGGIFQGYHIEHVFNEFAVWPFCDDNEWPYDPSVIGNQGEENMWGYVNVMSWQDQIFWFGSLPAVPTDDCCPDTNPGKKWWDFMPAPYQTGEERARGFGWWYQFGGIYLGDPYRYWAVRIGTEIEAQGGHYYDIIYLVHWGSLQGRVVRGGNPDHFIVPGHAFYYTYGNRQREWLHDRSFLDSTEGWPFSYTTIFDECPCAAEYASCGSWYEPDLCDVAEIEGHERYEGMNPPYDTAAYWEHRLQFNGETYVFEEANNGAYNGDGGSTQRCYPHYYCFAERAMHTGGWQIFKQIPMPEGGAEFYAYFYSHINMQGEFGYVKIDCTEFDEYDHVTSMQPFPGMEEVIENGVWHCGYTRLMMFDEEEHHDLGGVMLPHIEPV